MTDGGNANGFLGQPLEGDGDKWTLASFMLTISDVDLHGLGKDHRIHCKSRQQPFLVFYSLIFMLMLFMT